MFDPLILLLDVLICYRLTRLIVKDTLLQEVRWWLLRRWPSALTTFPDSIVTPEIGPGGLSNFGNLETGVAVFKSTQTDEDGDPVWMPMHAYKITELIECVYCASVWVSFAVMAFNAWHGWLWYLGSSLAVAGAVALIFARLDDD